MKELIDFCDIGNSIEYNNRIDCEFFNKELSNQQVDIIVNNCSLNIHPKATNLIISINHQPMIAFSFNYLREFYGYANKWQNANIELFCQEEIIDYRIRKIPYHFFVLYDKHNEFLIKSRNLSCIINNQTITIDRNFNNFNEFLKSNLSYFNTLS